MTVVIRDNGYSKRLTSLVVRKL